MQEGPKEEGLRVKEPTPNEVGVRGKKKAGKGKLFEEALFNNNGLGSEEALEAFRKGSNISKKMSILLVDLDDIPRTCGWENG